MPARQRRPRLETLVGRDTVVRGDISFQGALLVEGRVAGSVYGTGGADRLVLARHGVIEGSVELAQARIEGRVDGDVSGTTLVEIGATGLVTGTVRAQRVHVHAGGTITGAVVEQPLQRRRDPSFYGADP